MGCCEPRTKQSTNKAQCEAGTWIEVIPDMFANGGNSLRAALLRRAQWSWLMKNLTWVRGVYLQTRRPMVSSVPSEEGCPEDWGRWLLPSILCLCETPSGVLCPGLGPSTQERCWAFGEVPEVGHEDDPRAGALLLWRQAGGIGLIQPGKEKAVGKPHSGLPVFKGSLQTWGKLTFYTDR